MTDYEKITNFINKVFNYYNGKINTFSKAQLFIEFVNKSSIAATTKIPNIITVYPLSIIRYAKNEYDLYYLLLESIIHELYHIDQIIDYPRTMRDMYYMAQIECAVEEQTNIYLANHRQEIFEQFGIDVYMNSKLINNISKFSMGIYHRKRLPNHIIGILKEINSALPLNSKINMDELSFKIINTLNNNGIISLNFNNTIVKSTDNIDIFNYVIYNEYFKYELPDPYNVLVQESILSEDNPEQKWININIYYNPKRKMISFI